MTPFLCEERNQMVIFHPPISLVFRRILFPENDHGRIRPTAWKKQRRRTAGSGWGPT